jgi:hypothetical protein
MNDVNYQCYYPDGNFGGENVINTGHDMFWGFPVGEMTSEAWCDLLVQEYNGDRWFNTISTLPSGCGWQEFKNKFIDVPAVALRLYKLRGGH